MVIFNCDHYGALSQMIVLRYKFHQNEKSILLISQDDLKTNIYRALENKKIFDKVIPYNSRIGCFEGNKERAKQVICDYFKNLLEGNAIDLVALDRVYISFDMTNAFGIFVYYKRIGYSLVEMLPGSFFDSLRCKAPEEFGYADSAYTELLQETSAFTGDVNLVERYIYILPRPQEKNKCIQKRIVYIDFTKELSVLPGDVKQKLLDVYNVTSDDFRTVDTLVLPNSNGPLGFSGLPEERFPYLYQLVLDYWVTDAGNIVIKAHPYGLVDFSKKIPDVMCSLDGNFPIEYIALFYDVRIKNVVSLKTTAIDKIIQYVDNSIETGAGYTVRQLFRMMHRLYVTYSLVESIDNQCIKFHHMRNYRFLRKYLGYVFPQCKSKELNSIDPDNLNGNAFTVVACCPPTKKTDIRDDLRGYERYGLQNDGKNVITVFFNGNNGFDFYDVKGVELLNQVIPVKITKTALREDILADMSDEYIYVFAKDAEVREKVRTFTLSKTLYYTGIEIKVAPLEGSEMDLIKREICLEDMEIARREVVDCLTIL